MSGRVDIIVLSEIVLNDNNQQTKRDLFLV